MDFDTSHQSFQFHTCITLEQHRLTVVKPSYLHLLQANKTHSHTLYFRTPDDDHIQRPWPIFEDAPRFCERKTANKPHIRSGGLLIWVIHTMGCHQQLNQCQCVRNRDNILRNLTHLPQDSGSMHGHNADLHMPPRCCRHWMITVANLLLKMNYYQ